MKVVLKVGILSGVANDGEKKMMRGQSFDKDNCGRIDEWLRMLLNRIQRND